MPPHLGHISQTPSVQRAPSQWLPPSSPKRVIANPPGLVDLRFFEGGVE
jgi:hypothetical protein